MAAIFNQLLYSVGEFLRSPSWRQIELARLLNMRRYCKTSTRLFGNRIQVIDGASFYSAYKAIVERGIYDFDTAHPAPLIIDGGANVGIATIALRLRHPHARVIAFEPDSAIFDVLRSNVESMFASEQGITLVPAALWSSSHEQLPFHSEGADAGRVEIDRSSGGTSAVSAVRLRDYLDEPVALLKLDIEGAEAEVIRDCADRLHNVERIFVECHSFADQEQSCLDVIAVLKDCGFRLFLETEARMRQPLLSPTNYAGMDNQFNIFGLRR